ncbi:MAG: NHLP leader peptide family RiPP precursor [Candidatus Vecturithrix sp.]|jgi:hypothetical protein|nr:NHLP leader peptide family RiPP precursor [Candidatus Vecturithrix sp.]
MATWTEAEVQQVVKDVTTKATTDQQFRKALMANPRAVIKEVAGKEVPEGFNLKLIEADPGADLTVVIPPLETDELSDQELDQVAGGRGCRGLGVSIGVCFSIG